MLKEFQNLDPEEIIIINLRKLFENFGYEKLKLNVFEDYDIYHRNQDIIENENVLKLIHPSGKLYALRADMTISTAKKFALENNNEILTKKIYYYGTVFRNNTSLNSGLTQERQAGIECLGINDAVTDAEVLYLANETLSQITKEYALDISNVKFIKYIFEETNLKENDKEEILKLIYTKNSYDLDKFLLKFNNLDNKIKEAIKSIPSLYGNFEEVIKKARIFCLNENMNKILDYFQELLEILKIYKISDKVKIDFSISNSLHYYTGIIFQGYISDTYEPILLGGRYDKLCERFGKELPAIGFGITLNHVIKKIKNQNQKINYLLLYKNNDFSVFTKAQELRNMGKKVKIVPYKNISKEEFQKIKNKYSKIQLISNGELIIDFTEKEEICL